MSSTSPSAAFVPPHIAFPPLMQIPNKQARILLVTKFSLSTSSPQHSFFSLPPPSPLPPPPPPTTKLPPPSSIRLVPMMPHTISVAARYVMPTTAPFEKGIFIGRPAGTAHDDGFPRHNSFSGERGIEFFILQIRCLMWWELIITVSMGGDGWGCSLDCLSSDCLRGEGYLEGICGV